MRRLSIAAIGILSALAFAAPATAQNYGWQSHHDQQHDRLDQRHDDVHDNLGEEHAEAHEQGLSHWEHHQLHDQLQAQHDYADYSVNRQHQREHHRSDRRRSYDNRGYYPQYGY